MPYFHVTYTAIVEAKDEFEANEMARNWGTSPSGIMIDRDCERKVTQCTGCAPHGTQIFDCVCSLKK